MAEMTAEEVKELFKSYSFDGVISNQEAEGILRLIQQQAATITELQTEIAYQNKQIARLQEDLIKQVKEEQ